MAQPHRGAIEVYTTFFADPAPARTTFFHLP